MSTLPAEAALAVLESCLPVERPVSLHEPRFVGNEWAYVKDCLDTGWVSSVGRYVDQFEAILAEYTGSHYVVATVNGTAALHICLLSAGVQPGDEVLLPSLTFVATANAVSYCSAIPHFIDSAANTLGVDPIRLERYLADIAERRDGICVNRLTNRPIRAIAPMHVFGHPVDLDPLIDICRHWGLVLVEDAAESLGSTYKGRQTGTFGLVASLSFNGNKTITTGGGGAILTQDETLARKIRHLTTTARVANGWHFDHDEVGYNYRLPNLNAALGCAQMEALPGFLAAKKRLTERYRQAFSGVAGVHFIKSPDFAESNYWLNAILFDDPADRDRFLTMTNERGIGTRPAWTPMHRLPMYRTCPRMELPVVEDIVARLVNIPSSPFLGA